MRPLRFLVRLLVVLVVLAVIAAVVVDLLARSAAERQVADRVRSETGAASVSVHVESFPFLYDALFSSLSQVKVTATGVPVGPVTLSQVALDARDVRLDRHQLVFDQKAEVVSASSATFSAQVKASGLTALSNALDGQVSVVDGHVLVVTVAGHQVLSVDLTRNRLVPPCDYSLTTITGGYELSCTVAPVPQSILSILSQTS